MFNAHPVYCYLFLASTWFLFVVQKWPANRSDSTLARNFQELLQQFVDEGLVAVYCEKKELFIPIYAAKVLEA